MPDLGGVLRQGLIAASVFLSLTVLSSAEVVAQTAKPKNVVFKADFRGFPEIPSCNQSKGHGTVRASSDGRKVTYDLLVFDPKSQLTCTFSNGNAFSIPVGFWFDHYINGRYVDLNAGAAASIRAVYKYKRSLRLVDVVITFKAKGKTFKEHGSPHDVVQAMLPDREFTTGRWKP